MKGRGQFGCTRWREFKQEALWTNRLLDVDMTVKVPRLPGWGLPRKGGVLKSLIKLHNGWKQTTGIKVCRVGEFVQLEVECRVGRSCTIKAKEILLNTDDSELLHTTAAPKIAAPPWGYLLLPISVFPISTSG